MTDLGMIAGLIAAAACGAMALFSFVVAPLVFARLPAETAAAFIRQLFPVYYLVLAVVAGIATPLAGLRIEGAALAAVAVAFLALRFLLIPALDRVRERDKAAHARLHRLSVMINFIQMAVLAVVAVRLAG